MKLTTTQNELLNLISQYMGANNPIKYDVLKSLCDFKSFDSTFNALLNKGCVVRYDTNDYSNQYKLKN